MAGSQYLVCLAAAIGWFIAVWAIRRLPLRTRGGALMAAVVAGVPLLGWLTYCLGPIVGSLSFAAGLFLLMTAPMTPGRRTR